MTTTLMRKSLLALNLLFTLLVSAQDIHKHAAAVRTNLPIILDGILNDSAWKNATMIKELIEQRPTFGQQEAYTNRSELYLLYDDDAVYFGGVLRERSRDSIATQLVGRDNIGTNDFIGVIFDTYQDKINGLGFYVSPLNEQFDVKYSIGDMGGEDISWSTVYHTATRITDEGWSFEMQIPYSALRFARGKSQDWNMQIIRRRAKTAQQYSWSPLDPTKMGFMNQAGTLTGIDNIKPPVRLSFSPYFSTYANHEPDGKNWKTTVNGGMDVKYGITDGFTMDMTLVPDFGQVQSDNQVLNLTPFEVKFNENRPFFTEGTELFSQADIFYSRRIGGQPLHYYDVENQMAAGDKVISSPLQSKLINATKVSGRTKSKLGIGFFNAITKPQYAVIERLNKEQYKIQTDPLTNYNILVVEQAMKNNSRVTVINTNVTREGKDYDANVTAIDWDLYDNNVNWNFWGQANHSNLSGLAGTNRSSNGNAYELYLGKFKGRLNFEAHRKFADDKYDQSDMGYFTYNNFVTHGGQAWYKWVKPKSFYNNIRVAIEGDYTEHFKTRQYQDASVEFRANSQLKNLWTVGLLGDVKAAYNDFYESRVDNRMVKRPSSWMKGVFVNSNTVKKYSFQAELYHRVAKKYDTRMVEARLVNSYRFNDRISVSLSEYTEFFNRNFGFAFINMPQDSIFMSLRNIRTVENLFSIKYSFTNKMGLTLRVRHYWSKVRYYDFKNLKLDGTTEEVSNVSGNPDINVNLFNVDMNYTWQFGPGSFINITWKTASQLYNQLVRERYYNNLDKSIATPAFNSLSFKLIYFLDYLSLKKKGKSV